MSSGTIDFRTTQFSDSNVEVIKHSFFECLEDVRFYIGSIESASDEYDAISSFRFLKGHYNMLGYYMSILREYLAQDQNLTKELVEIVQKFELLEKKYDLKYREP